MDGPNGIILTQARTCAKDSFLNSFQVQFADQVVIHSIFQASFEATSGARGDSKITFAAEVLTTLNKEVDTNNF